MTKKICSKCNIEKDVCEFYKNPKKEGEVRTRCKKCMNKISLENYYQNVETERERRRKYHKQYYLENKEKENLRNKTFDIVGCSPNYLREHIEKQFLEGMNWENYGFYGWHIDHKIPLSSAKNEEEILKLFHYTNLQPLWAEENLRKNKKILN